MRKLVVQWMIDGPGGYTAHRWTVPFPNLLYLFLALCIVVEIWLLTKGLANV